MDFIRKPFRYTNFGAVYWLIGINALVFALTQFMDPRSRIMLMLRMAMIPELVLEGRVWTFVTYMFLHDMNGFRHILFNMLGIFIFGNQVERQMGSKEFLLYYFVTGIMAGFFSFLFYVATNQNVALVGASGALFAVMLAYAVLFPDSIIYIWGIIPLRAPVLVLGYTGLELFFSITGGRGNVAHLTHLAGFAFGWIYIVARYRMSPWKRLTGRY